VVAGAVEQERIAFTSIVAGGFAFVAAVCFWWIYFDNVDERAVDRFTDEPEQRTTWTALAWTYIHLPLTASLTAFGVGVSHLVAHSPSSPLADADRWLLCGAAAVALFSLAVIHLDTEGRAAQRQAGAHVAGADAAARLPRRRPGAAGADPADRRGRGASGRRRCRADPSG
jgi:low temperature requirement protein LtrA